MNIDKNDQEYFLKYYIRPCIFLMSVCSVVLLTAGILCFLFGHSSIGMGILLFLGVIVAAFAIIALVASYREISRLHNNKLNVESSKGFQDLFDEMYKEIKEKAKVRHWIMC